MEEVPGTFPAAVPVGLVVARVEDSVVAFSVVFVAVFAVTCSVVLAPAVTFPAGIPAFAGLVPGRAVSLRDSCGDCLLPEESG